MNLLCHRGVSDASMLCVVDLQSVIRRTNIIARDCVNTKLFIAFLTRTWIHDKKKREIFRVTTISTRCIEWIEKAEEKSLRSLSQSTHNRAYTHVCSLLVLMCVIWFSFYSVRRYTAFHAKMCFWHSAVRADVHSVLHCLIRFTFPK